MPQPPHTPPRSPATPRTQTSPCSFASKFGHFSRPSNEDLSPAPSDLTRRGIHIPVRTSSRCGSKRNLGSRSRDTSSSLPTTPERDFSSAGSFITCETTNSSPSTISKKRSFRDDSDRLEPLLEDDPCSFDLLVPNSNHGSREHDLEISSDLLFSRDHLDEIFADPTLLLSFTSYLSTYRSQSIPILIYYLDALKALRAVNYANAVAEALEPISGYSFTEHPARPTVNSVLEGKAQNAFDKLVSDDLPAYVTHIFIQLVNPDIHKMITCSSDAHMKDGLGEMFCLSDPSRIGNPIVFASDGFLRNTQYELGHVLGRNSRFLQGPKTNPCAVQRLRTAIVEGRQTSEVILNYRRDGSTFMNLLMVVPLRDNCGNIRYYLGAQVDVSGLVRNCSDLEALQRAVKRKSTGADAHTSPKDEFQELSEMFNMIELETVSKHGGRMHREKINETKMLESPLCQRIVKDPSNYLVKTSDIGKNPLDGAYKNYLLLRPHPSLRIVFTSASLRIPGILQSSFHSRIGGSSQMRENLLTAFAEGRSVTALIHWLTSHNDAKGRPRWIHCTPLFGRNGAVGVWVVVLVDVAMTYNRYPGQMLPLWIDTSQRWEKDIGIPDEYRLFRKDSGIKPRTPSSSEMSTHGSYTLG